MQKSLTKSQEDYLEAIYSIIQEKSVARVRDIANLQNVKTPSVNTAVAELKKRELVEQERYGYITLTEIGLSAAEDIVRRHIILRNFLSSLGVSEQIAERDACHMEHVLSPETYDAIRAYMQTNSAALRSAPN